MFYGGYYNIESTHCKGINSAKIDFYIGFYQIQIFHCPSYKNGVVYSVLNKLQLETKLPKNLKHIGLFLDNLVLIL